MKSTAFLLFILFSLLACFVLTISLANSGWNHVAPWAGLTAMALLIRGGFRLFYTEA